MSDRDFTHRAYASLLTTLRGAGFALLPFDALGAGPAPPSPTCLLRHDVDRLPARAVALARVEHGLGVRATYFVRMRNARGPRAAVRALRELGHEIGYHYEDFAATGGDPTRAWASFQRNLAALRDDGPVDWIAMHGRPLSRFDSRDLWRHHDYHALGLREAYADLDWSRWRYFTDTGRGWNRGTNLRDYPPVPGAAPRHDGDTPELAQRLAAERQDAVLSTHPERWTASVPGWLQVLVTDWGLSRVKEALRVLRGARVP